MKPKVNIFAKIMIKMIIIYKKIISPALPRSCRFIPTCSEYAIEAIQKYGAVKGSWMAIKRILRCNRFCKSGYDPVE